jgi:FlaG/FlaF family flagellin (archaellin)
LGLDEARLKGRRSRGVSPVIATIILSAAVITIGAAVWNYSQGAATVIANDYVNGTLDLLKEVTERFTIEHVSNNTVGSIMYVWIFNFGDVDITVDLYANATGKYSSTLGTNIASGDLVKIDVSFEGAPLQVDDEVALKVHSRRQNNVYYTYYVT